MRKIKKDKRKTNDELIARDAVWYRKKIVEMVHKIDDEKFLNQIAIILKKHVEKKGD